MPDQTGFTREASESHRRCPLLYNPNLASCPKLLCADSRLDFVYISTRAVLAVDRESPTLLYLSSACERLKLDLSLGRPLSPCMLAKATSGTNEWVVDLLEPDAGLIGRRGVL